MRTMRLVIAHSRLNSFGGGERTLVELLKRLSASHEVALWASDYAPEATYAELAAFPRRMLRSYEWFTATPDADVVLAQTFGARLLALRHPRTLCYIHTMRSPYLLGGQRPDYSLRRLLDNTAIGCAAQLLTNSAYTAKQVEAVYYKHAIVLPPGVDERFLASPLSVGSYALYVGRLAPEKGIERLLRWYADLPLPLVIAGAGDAAYTHYLRSLAGPQVQFVGAQTGAALRDLYAGCRYLAFLPYAEEFGLVALEALAAGKPVIAARDGALPELVVDEQTGFLVSSQSEFTNAATRLACDDALCLQLGQQGREVARGYSWDRFAASIEQACWDAIQRDTPTFR